MAFDKINEFTLNLKNQWLVLEQKINTELISSEKRQYYRTKQNTIRDCLIEYDTTVLTITKFKTQKLFLRKCLIEIEPAFSIGYYKIKQSN